MSTFSFDCRSLSPFVVTLFVTYSAFSSTTVKANTLLDTCKVKNFLDLSFVAQGYIDLISSKDVFDWGLGSNSKEVLQTARLHNAKLKGYRAKWQESHAWAPILLKVRDQIVASPSLKAFRKNELLNIDFEAVDECGTACIQGFNFSIGIVPGKVDLLYNSDPNEFEQRIRFLIAHEVGHYIQSYGMWTSGRFSSRDEFYQKYGEMSYRKLHLEVDAIALILGNLDRHTVFLSLNSMASMLESNGKASGDLPMRAQCFADLP